jgi:hypothetical protein
MSKKYGYWNELYENWKSENPQYSDPSDRGKFVRGCIHKLAYPDFLMAINACLSMERDLLPKKGKNMGIYLCPICKMNHIGHQRDSPQRNVDREYFNPNYIPKSV